MTTPTTTNKYYYKGVDIAKLIVKQPTTPATPISAPPTSVYTGFPSSVAPEYHASGLDKPANFSYRYSINTQPTSPGNPQPNDVSNYATAYTEVLSGTDQTLTTTIPFATGYSFKHISVYAWGGGGGGGGGGGSGYGFYIQGGGDGGGGGNGGYAAIVSYPIVYGPNYSIKYSVGNGGSRGTGGAPGTINKSSGAYNAGDPGNSGSDGNSSYVYLTDNSDSTNTTIALAPGGNSGGGGNAGKGATPGESGTTGTAGTPGAGTIASPGYNGSTTGSNDPTSYPNQGSGGNGGSGGGGAAGGNGGGNGNATEPNAGTPGSDGDAGYVKVYLTYQ
jgi:hypothetical protein